MGTPEHWAPKDSLAHSTFWRGVGAVRMFDVKRREQPDFEIPGVIESYWTDIADSSTDFQRYNEETFEREHLRPFADVLADSQRTFDLMIAGVEALSEAQLIDTQAFPWLEGRPLWHSPLGNGYEHPLEHLAHFYRERGDLANAERLMTQQTAGMLGLDASDETRGGSYLQPGLLLGARRPTRPRDPPPPRGAGAAPRPHRVVQARTQNLVSLRGLPAFQAIYTATGA